MVDPPVNYGCKCATDGNTAIADCQICEHRAGEYGQHCLRCNAGKFLWENRCRESCVGLRLEGIQMVEYSPGSFGRECRAPFTCNSRLDGAGGSCKCPRSVGKNDCATCHIGTDTGDVCVRCTNNQYLRQGTCVPACREGEAAVGTLFTGHAEIRRG